MIAKAHPNLAAPLFTASIEVGVSDGEHLAFLRSVPSHGLGMGQVACSRDVLNELLGAGLIRADALGSVHLTTCGRLWIREIERTL